MKNFMIQKDSLHFSVDYYVELLGVLSILCEDQDAICEAGCACGNEAYVKEVKAYFQNADHEKVTRALSLFSDEYHFNYDAPVQLMLWLSNGLPIDKKTLFKDRKEIPDELFDAFLTDFKEFERASDFKSFYEAHIPTYRTVAEHFMTDYERYNSHEYLYNFFAIAPEHELYINFMFGITNANYGVTAGKRLYANLRPYDETRYGDLPDYSYNPIYFSTLILHEFAHSFVNPLTSRHSDLIAAIDPTKYAAALDEFCYGDSIETLINETVIRAMECLYVKELFPQHYEAYAADYEDEGYTKLREVIEALKPPLEIERIIALF